MGSFKRLLPVAAALLLKVGITAAFYMFPVPGLLAQEGTKTTMFAIIGIDIILFVLTLLHFATASSIDPGIIPRVFENDDDDMAPLYKTVEIRGVNVQMKWCSTCKFYRPPRSSHCSVCDNCVQNFDHHCPWLGNCIGRRNYRFFYWYLVCLTLHMIITFISTLIYIIIEAQKDQFSVSSKEMVSSIVILVFVFISFFFVCGLMSFHTFLITNGRSTYEQFSSRYPVSSPFDLGYKHNWIRTFCVPIPPSLMPPEPHVEINRGSICQNQTKKMETRHNYDQFKVTVKSNNSQRVRLLEADDGGSIGTCSMNGDLDRPNGRMGESSLSNLPLSLSASIQNLTEMTTQSGLVCTLPQETHIEKRDTIVKVKHSDL